MKRSRIGGKLTKKYQVNTPFQNPNLEDNPKFEIEITDPTHPLFGRRFELFSVSNPASGEAHAFVRYRDYMRLKIPISATNLEPPPFCLATKLSLESLKSMLKLIKDSEELCHIYPEKSIQTYPRNIKNRSGKKS